MSNDLLEFSINDSALNAEKFMMDAAIAGVAAYNNHKLKKKASRESPGELVQRVPLVQASPSNR